MEPTKIFYTIADSICFSLKIIIPVFFIVRVCRVSLRLDMQILIRVLNYTLLIAGVFYLAEILSVIINDHYSPVDPWHNAIFNRATGPYWFAFWLPVIINGLLPQLLWRKKNRASVKVLYTWCILAILLSALGQLVLIEASLNRDIALPGQAAVWLNYLFFPSVTYCTLSLTGTVIILAALYLAIGNSEKKAGLNYQR